MSQKLDLLIVNPPGKDRVYQGLSDELTAIEPPVRAAMIAAFIRSAGFSVEILDADAHFLNINETASTIIDRNPLLTIFAVYGHQPSASTQCMPAAGSVARKVKGDAPQLKTVFMGSHVSALPELTLKEEAIDFVCQGEGVYTIRDLLKTLKRDDEQYSEIGGLWYREDGSPVYRPPYPLIHDLSRELPDVAWDLLDMSRYRAHNWHCWSDPDNRSPYAAIYTSFGCPFKCIFCCINAAFGKSAIRYFSPETVIKVIDELVNKYGVKNIKISDEMFVFNEKHVTDICDLIISRGYDLNIWAYARIDTIKERVLEKLKLAGFNWLAVGIESASNFVRDGVSKGRFDEEDIIASVGKIRSAGINIMANYIFGLPDDDKESMNRTLNLAKELNTESANFYCAMAYPGSRLYQSAKEKGLKLPNDADGPGWIGYSQHSYETLPLPTNHLSAGEVLSFRDKAFHSYFSSDSYLSMMKTKFGDNVVTYLENMNKKKLKRRYIPTTSHYV